MNTLDELFAQFGSDKSTVHPNAHGYAKHYEAAFASIKNEPVRVLEIGVGSGASVKAWLDWFPKASVFGVDKNYGTNEWDTTDTRVNPRYTFTPGDQSSQDFWKLFIIQYGSGWDIIVDDGGHYADQVITSFNCLWPHVKSGGFYAIEDLNVAYPDLWEKYGDQFVKPPWINHMDFVKGKLDVINRKNEIDSMRFSKELCILQKV